MPRFIIKTTTLVILLAALVCGCEKQHEPGLSESQSSSTAPDNSALVPASHEIKIRTQFVVKNNSGQSKTNVTIGVFLPISQSGFMSTAAHIPSRDALLQTDKFGNTVAVFSIPILAPYQSLNLNTDSTVQTWDAPHKPVTQIDETYLKPQLYIESDSDRIRAVANTLSDGSTKAELPRVIHQWVQRNIRKLDYVADSRGALSTIKMKAGDCTEAAYLFAALARASGIPARVLGGYVLPNGGAAKASQYHNWAEFLVENHWEISDPNRDVFAEQQNSYIPTRILGLPKHGDHSDKHRFWSNNAGVSVTQR